MVCVLLLAICVVRWLTASKHVGCEVSGRVLLTLQYGGNYTDNRIETIAWADAIERAGGHVEIYVATGRDCLPKIGPDTFVAMTWEEKRAACWKIDDLENVMKTRGRVLEPDRFIFWTEAQRGGPLIYNSSMELAEVLDVVYDRERHDAAASVFGNVFLARRMALVAARVDDEMQYCVRSTGRSTWSQTVADAISFGTTALLGADVSESWFYNRVLLPLKWWLVG